MAVILNFAVFIESSQQERPFLEPASPESESDQKRLIFDDDSDGEVRGATMRSSYVQVLTFTCNTTRTRKH